MVLVGTVRKSKVALFRHTCSFILRQHGSLDPCTLKSMIWMVRVQECLHSSGQGRSKPNYLIVD